MAPKPPTLGAPRRSRGAPRYSDRLLAHRSETIVVLASAARAAPRTAIRAADEPTTVGTALHPSRERPPHDGDDDDPDRDEHLGDSGVESTTEPVAHRRPHRGQLLQHSVEITWNSRPVPPKIAPCCVRWSSSRSSLRDSPVSCTTSPCWRRAPTASRSPTTGR